MNNLKQRQLSSRNDKYKIKCWFITFICLLAIQGAIQCQSCSELYTTAYSFYENEKTDSCIIFINKAIECNKILKNKKLFIENKRLLADCYRKQHLYQEERLLRKEILSEVKKFFGDTSTQYTYSLLAEGIVLFDLSRYDSSITNFEKVINLLVTNGEDDGLTYYLQVAYLPMAYIFSGNTIYARNTLRKASSLTEYVKKKEWVLDYNQTFFFYYIFVDSLQRADSIMEVCRNIVLDMHGEYSQQYQIVLMQQATFYNKIKNSERAKETLEYALNLLEKSNSSEHQSQLVIIQQLASAEINLTNYTKALNLIQKGLTIVEGIKSEDYYLLKSKAELYSRAAYLHSIPDFEFYAPATAENYYNKCVEAFKSLKLYDDNLLLFNDLGQFYESVGKDEKARHFYQLLEKKIANLERESIYYSLLHVLARFHSKQKETAAKSLLEWKGVDNYEVQKFTNNLYYLSYAELLSYLDHLETDKNVYYNSLLNIKNNFSFDLEKILFEKEMFLKGLAVNLKKIKDTLAKQSSSPGIRLLQDSLRKVNIILSSLQDVHQQNTRQIASDLEKRISIETIANVDLKSKLQVSFATVQNALQNDEAILEFLSIQHYDKKWSDTTDYYVLVLRKDFRLPKLLLVCNNKQLEGFFRSEKTNEYLSNMMNELKNIHRLFIVSTGALHYYNFAKLQSDHGYLLENFDIHYVTNSKEVITFQRDKNYINSFPIILFGGVDYDRNNLPVKSKQLQSSERGNYPFWSYLPGTLYEVKKIGEIAKNHTISYTTFLQAEASEENFRSISAKKDPFTLHIASHGYFFPNSKKNEKVSNFSPRLGKVEQLEYADNPLFRSGLVFAGVNRNWKNIDSTSDVSSDGIITAYDISLMDLSNCQLVVLSACETGFGDVKGSEGVFGLQRAFKMAGVKNIIMSLWKVPDEQTAELFELFYKNYFDGMSFSKALAAAQLDMSKRYPPYYWAAFKLLE